MKKNVILLLMVFQCAIMSQNLRIGFNASANNETRTSKGHNFLFSGSEVDFKSENSYNYGLVGLLKIYPEFYLNTSILITSKKVSTYWTGPADGKMDITLYYDYLSLSPKIEYNPILGIYLNAGPTIDFKINTKMEQSGDYSENQDEIIGTSDVRLGMIFSVGYRLDFLGSSSLAAEISYDLGITDTNSRLGGKYSSSRAGLVFYFK